MRSSANRITSAGGTEAMLSLCRRHGRCPDRRGQTWSLRAKRVFSYSRAALIGELSGPPSDDEPIQVAATAATVAKGRQYLRRLPFLRPRQPGPRACGCRNRPSSVCPSAWGLNSGEAGRVAPPAGSAVRLAGFDRFDPGSGDPDELAQKRNPSIPIHIGAKQNIRL